MTARSGTLVPPSAARARSRRRTRSPRTTCCSALRLDQHIPGLVDGYFGPAELKARVDTGAAPRAGPAARGRRRARARAYRDEVAEPTGATGSTAQLVALEAHAAGARRRAAAVRGARRALLRASRRRATTTPSSRRAARRSTRCCPGDGPAGRPARRLGRRARDPGRSAAGRHRLARRRGSATAAAATVRPARRRGPARLARHAASRGPATTGTTAAGARGSTSTPTCPVRAPDLVHTVAHETYPGHHLEHAWKEADLVDRLGRLEASILLINTPECPISEGLADLGHVVRRSARGAGRPAASSCSSGPGCGRGRPGAAREAAERAVALAGTATTLAAIRGNAALLRHADGASHDEVLAYLQDVGGYAPEVAAKRLEFIEHPLWRTYVFVYAEGEALLRRWLEAVPGARAGRAVRPAAPRAGHAGSTPRGAGLTVTRRAAAGRPATAIANPAVRAGEDGQREDGEDRQPAGSLGRGQAASRARRARR